MAWTLEYNGAEKTFPQWGFTDPMLHPASLEASKFTVRVPGVDVLAAAPIPYDGAVIVRRDGTIIFQGTQSMCKKQMLPSVRQDLLTFSDPWWQLQQTVFQQAWSVRQATEDTNTTKYFSRLNLFQAFPSGFPQTTGATIVEILNWAISCGVNLQIGNIDPNKFLPPTPIRAVVCSDAIITCLKLDPDATAWLDLSTVPPTFHCRTGANKPPVSVVYRGHADGVHHKSTEIAERPDLQPSSVVIQYQEAGAPAFSDLFVDAHPPGSTGREIGSLVLPYDVRGFSMSVITGSVRAAAFATNDLNWWRLKKPELADGRVSGLAQLSGGLHPVTVTDDAGNAVNLALYPNEYVDGNVNPWMTMPGGTPVRVIEATVTADFSYVEKDPSGTIKLNEFGSHRITARVKLTNSPIGLAPYSALASLDSGETIPDGLAEQIYNSLSVLQYEGEHVLVEPGGPSQIIGPWNVLRITGGDPAWADARMTIQSTSIDFFRGVTTIQFGPAKHLGPGDMIEFMMGARSRVVYENVNARITGQSGGAGSSSETGRSVPRENTTAGLVMRKYFGGLYQQS